MSVNERYWQEAERFRDALLRADIGTRVAKIYLFGSLARGVATEHSDIDLLVVLCDGDEGARAVAETLLDLQLDGCGPLEPVTCSIEDLFPVQDYFLYSVVRHGKELYTMPEAELRRTSNLTGSNFYPARAPYQYYTGEEAGRCLSSAESILDEAKRLLRT